MNDEIRSKESEQLARLLRALHEIRRCRDVLFSADSQDYSDSHIEYLLEHMRDADRALTAYMWNEGINTDAT